MVHDLPAGGKRRMQKVHGYDATIVSGQITYRDGEATGELPGRLGARTVKRTPALRPVACCCEIPHCNRRQDLLSLRDAFRP